MIYEATLQNFLKLLLCQHEKKLSHIFYKLQIRPYPCLHCIKKDTSFKQQRLYGAYILYNELKLEGQFYFN